MTVYWVETSLPGRVGTMPRPHGGPWLEASADALADEGVDLLVSLLTDREVALLGLTDAPEALGRRGIGLWRFPVPDHGVPAAPARACAFVQRTADEVRGGASVAFHCFAGIGRSTLLAVCTLACLGVRVSRGFELVEEARGLPVPDTDEQEAWARQFERFLGLGPGR